MMGPAPMLVFLVNSTISFLEQHPDAQERRLNGGTDDTQSAQPIVGTLMFASGFFVCTFLFFDVALRPNFWWIYNTRNRHPVYANSTPADPKHFWSWIPLLISDSLEDDELIFLRWGTDALVLLHFMRFCTQNTFFATVVSCGVLLPIYYCTYDPGEDDMITGFEKTTLATVLEPDRRLLAPVIAAWLLTLHTMALLDRFWRRFVQWRLRHLVAQAAGLSVANKDTAVQESLTLLVENIPEPLQSSSKLHQHFELLFPGEVHSAVVMLRNTAELTNLANQFEVANQLLERLLQGPIDANQQKQCLWFCGQPARCLCCCIGQPGKCLLPCLPSSWYRESRPVLEAAVEELRAQLLMTFRQSVADAARYQHVYLSAKDSPTEQLLSDDRSFPEFFRVRLQSLRDDGLSRWLERIDKRQRKKLQRQLLTTIRESVDAEFQQRQEEQKNCAHQAASNPTPAGDGDAAVSMPLTSERGVPFELSPPSSPEFPSFDIDVSPRRDGSMRLRFDRSIEHMRNASMQDLAEIARRSRLVSLRGGQFEPGFESQDSEPRALVEPGSEGGSLARANGVFSLSHQDSVLPAKYAEREDSEAGGELGVDFHNSFVDSSVRSTLRGSIRSYSCWRQPFDPCYRFLSRTFGELRTDVNDQLLWLGGVLNDLLFGIPAGGEPVGTGFVTLKSQTAKSSAIQTNLFAHKFAMSARQAPEVRDIIFSNVMVPHRRIMRRQYFTSVWVFFGCIFWSATSVFITGLPDIMRSFVIDDTDRPLVIFLSEHMPVLALLGFLNLLPLLFMCVSRFYEQRKSISEVDTSVMSRFFDFQMANLYVSLMAATVIASAHDAIQLSLNDPANFIELIGSNISASGSFFMQFLIIKFGTCPLWLWRTWPLISRGWTEPALPAEVPAVPFGWAFPKLLLVLLISYTYWIIAPLCVPVACILFFCHGLFFRYLIVWNHMPHYESGGKFWYYIFRRIVLGLILSNLFLVLAVYLKGDSWYWVMLFPLPFVVGVFGEYCRVAYELPSIRLSRADALAHDRAVREAEKLEEGIESGLASQPGMPPKNVVDGFSKYLYTQPSVMLAIFQDKKERAKVRREGRHRGDTLQANADAAVTFSDEFAPMSAGQPNRPKGRGGKASAGTGNTLELVNWPLSTVFRSSRKGRSAASQGPSESRGGDDPTAAAEADTSSALAKFHRPPTATV